MRDTVVIFRVLKNCDSISQSLIAIFPEEPADSNPYCCLSYGHVGQHGSCDPLLCIRCSRPARPTEYRELKRELKRIGYHLKVAERYTDAMQRRRQQKAQQCHAKDYRKARPYDIFAAINTTDMLRPRRDETFAQYQERLSLGHPEGCHDALVIAMVLEGWGEPSQREYLQRISDLRDDLMKVHFALHKEFKERK